ncbi:MAG: hypothetical protein K2N52_05640, partial [Clostridia bacterium]|nr:hypothetical protein [Clostridia bacterium]
LVNRDYRIKTRCSINEGKRREEVEWKVFSYSGNKLSAILVSDKLYAATSFSFIGSMMEGLNAKVNNPPEEGNGKYLKFDEDFLPCINGFNSGKSLRLLRASEHEESYIQLKEALEKVPINDVEDDGYYFVLGTADGKEKVLFADRGSTDVYRHIHVDAYASIIPVIDFDYEMYKQYIINKSKA